jgi:hypothetical protein
MKEKILKPLKSLQWIALFGVILWACQDDSDSISSEQAAKQSNVTVRDNSEIIAATQGAMEITADVFEDEGISNGRASTSGRIQGGGHHGDGDHHNDDGCRPNISGSFDLDRSHKDSLIYRGTLIIDYGDGSTCDSTDVKKGKITDTFTFILTWGDSVSFTSTETLTFEGFVRDSVQLDGTFVTTKVNHNTKTVEAQDVRITYADTTSVSWSGVLDYTYEHGDKCKWKDNTVHVTGSIDGVNREGVAFSLVITEELVFKYKCNKHRRSHPVSGVVQVTVGGVVSTIDFGDGACDKTYTITTNGVTEEITFGNHH